MLQFHHTMIYLTIVFLLRVRSQTLCAQWTCHVLRTHLSRIPVSCITCHRLVYSYILLSISRVSLLVRIWTVDSSTTTCLFHISLFVSSTRTLMFLAYVFLLLSCRLVSMLTITAYTYSLQSVDSSLDLSFDSFPFCVHL